MKGPKKNTEKINNLLNAFSALSDSDVEEARAVIAAAGKDPDEIVKKGMGRIGVIREQISKKRAASSASAKLPYPVFQLEASVLSLSAQLLPEADILTIEQAYPLLITRDSTYTYSQSAQDIRLIRFQREILIRIEIGPDEAAITGYIGMKERIGFPLEAIGLMGRTGYFINGKECLPLDRDSLEFASGLLAQLTPRGTLPLRVALGYFASRHNHKWTEFAGSGFDMQGVLLSSTYDQQSRLFIRDLYDYQKDGLKWLIYCFVNRLGGILGDDMGLGKTAQIIALVAVLTEKALAERILIIVPSTLLENWRREFEFFAPQIVPHIHHGSLRGGSVTELAEKQVVITSYSMIINDQFLFNKITWGLTVLDEASLIKNPDSERRTALEGLQSEVSIAMTGTPVENSLLDLWSVADFVRRGYLGSRKDFTSRFVKKAGSTAEADLDLGGLREDVSYIMLRRKKEDVLGSLPERIDIHQALVMDDEEAALYEQRREGMKERTGAGEAILLEMITELRIHTTHPFIRMQPGEQKVSVRELSRSSSKFRRTMELLEEMRTLGEKVLIFTEFTRMTDMFSQALEAHFGTEVYTIDGRIPVGDRQKNIDAFSQVPGFSVMVLNPRTAGMGLNITAANHVIHYTRQWNPALEEQASARAYRNGQRRGVNIYYLYYAGTVEEVIDARLRSKQALSGEVISVTGADNIEDYLNALNLTPKKQ